MSLAARHPLVAAFLLGAAVGLAGDATHVASGTTRYLWDGVPAVWRSAVWFPLLVGAGLAALAAVGARSGLPEARERTGHEVLAGAAAVLALYALTATLRGRPATVGVVLTGALAVVVWAWWDPSAGAAVGGALAAVLGPLAEVGVVALGAAEYADGSDGLAGVAPWLPALYFAAGAVGFRLVPALTRMRPRPPSRPPGAPGPAAAAAAPGSRASAPPR